MCGKNIKIIGFKKGISPINTFNKRKQIYVEHKFTIKNNTLFDIYEFKRGFIEEV